MLIVGVASALAYWWIGLPSPLGLAFIAALTNFIPYLGPIAGAVPMPTELYLDTARFGRTRRRAWHAQRDFLRLCAEEAGSAHIEALLRDGHDSWPDRLRARYPALADWRGVAGMKGAVRV